MVASFDDVLRRQRARRAEARRRSRVARRRRRSRASVSHRPRVRRARQRLRDFPRAVRFHVIVRRPPERLERALARVRHARVQ